MIRLVNIADFKTKEVKTTVLLDFKCYVWTKEKTRRFVEYNSIDNKTIDNHNL